MLRPMYTLIQNRDLLSNQTIWNVLLPSCSQLCLMKCMTTCFVPLLSTLHFFFFSNFDLCEFEKGGPIWPTVVSPHWCWTDSYCIFSNLQQKCVSVVKNRISFPKWFSRTEKVGRGIFKIFFRYNGLQLAFSSTLLTGADVVDSLLLPDPTEGSALGSRFVAIPTDMWSCQK